MDINAGWASFETISATKRSLGLRSCFRYACSFQWFPLLGRECEHIIVDGRTKVVSQDEGLRVMMCAQKRAALHTNGYYPTDIEILDAAIRKRPYESHLVEQENNIDASSSTPKIERSWYLGHTSSKLHIIEDRTCDEDLQNSEHMSVWRRITTWFYATPDVSWSECRAGMVYVIASSHEYIIKHTLRAPDRPDGTAGWFRIIKNVVNTLFGHIFVWISFECQSSLSLPNIPWWSIIFQSAYYTSVFIRLGSPPSRGGLELMWELRSHLHRILWCYALMHIIWGFLNYF